ncbi:MAG: dihydrodipicolinate synthase family protein, partial [Planctomycetota bacterium]
LVDAAGTDRMLSGLGDQPARTHMRRFGLAGFTTGCGCVAPNLCRQLLAAIKDGDDARAAEIEALFLPLEDLRNGHGPITVLHAAVELAGIAPTGPVIPLLTEVDAALREPIRTAAKELLEADATATRTS